MAGLLAPGVARAQGLEGRFSIAFQAGTQSEVAGDLMKGTQGTLIGKPVTLESKRYRDVYAPDLRLQGQVGFGLSDKLEIVGLGTWYKAEATGSRRAPARTCRSSPSSSRPTRRSASRSGCATTSRARRGSSPTWRRSWACAS